MIVDCVLLLCRVLHFIVVCSQRYYLRISLDRVLLPFLLQKHHLSQKPHHTVRDGHSLRLPH
jgi:hypothetical protein